jgi:hypothetical protein
VVVLNILVKVDAHLIVKHVRRVPREEARMVARHVRDQARQLLVKQFVAEFGGEGAQLDERDELAEGDFFPCR